MVVVLQMTQKNLQYTILHKKYKSLTGKYEPTSKQYSDTLPQQLVNDNPIDPSTGLVRTQVAKPQLIDNTNKN